MINNYLKSRFEEKISKTWRKDADVNKESRTIKKFNCIVGDAFLLSKNHKYYSCIYFRGNFYSLFKVSRILEKK